MVALGAIAVAWWFHHRERVRLASLVQRQTVARAVTQERLAMARELHDVVSNGLALMTLRASVATLSPDDDPAALRTALLDVEGLGRSATQDLRRMLRALRHEQDVNDSGARLASLDDLATTARQAGVQVTATGLETPVHSALVRSAVHRIVQEALANTARHAGPSSCHVEVSRSGDMVRVLVRDEGAAPGWRGASGSGMGLAGLRERVAILGGTFAAGPSGRGFRVEAHLPDTADDADD